MGKEEMNYVAISIDKKLRSLRPSYSDQCIFKVPNYVRMANEKAYEPYATAIGPYHRGKDHLKAMEEHKVRYVQKFLGRSEMSVSELVGRIEKLEERARKCYAELVSLTKDEFTEMMILDGCLIVGMFTEWTQDDLNDLIFQRATISTLPMDLILVENQIPFFILVELLDMMRMSPELLIKTILDYFSIFLPGEGHRLLEHTDIKQIKHLLGLIYENWQPLPARMEICSENEERSLPRCASKLQDAGIRFKKAEGRNLFDINFKKGILEIPRLIIGDETEVFMRNFIAYEQVTSGRSRKTHVSDYMRFIDNLINSGKDVELLSSHGIIENCMGDDVTVATLFNKIGYGVISDRTLYADIEGSLTKHCERQWNEWMAKLRHDYFSSPWALISLLAAVFLLILTCVQSVFTILSYYKN